MAKGRKTGGRRAGTPNRSTSLLKEAILLAAEKAGGPHGIVGYLTRQANESPSAFLSLIGRILPTQVTGEDGGPVQAEIRSTVAALDPAQRQQLRVIAESLVERAQETDQGIGSDG